MKIRDVEVYYLHATVDEPWSFSLNPGYSSNRSATLVRVLTDEGIEGWGEAGAAHKSRFSPRFLNDVLKPLVIGEDPLNREKIWAKLHGHLASPPILAGYPLLAISGVDIALWDIAGKAAGVPICTLLGGALRDRVCVYASGLYYNEDDDETHVKLRKEAERYREQGYLGVKMKIGRLAPTGDLCRIAEVRKAIGPDLKLAVDANQVYNAYSAKEIGRRMEEYDVCWFEEPVPATDIEGYLDVKAGQNIPIAGGECIYDRFTFGAFLSRRAMDIAQPDAADAGGITECKKISTIANAFGAQTNLHCSGTTIDIAAALHLSATFPLSNFVGVPRPFYQETVLEFHRLAHPIRDKVGTPVFVAKDGYVDVPMGPGLGIEIDLDFVKRMSVG